MILKSIKIWKEVFFIVLVTIMLLAFNYMYAQYNNNKYPASPKLSVICFAFINMQPTIESMLYNKRIPDENLEKLYRKWDDLHLEDKNIFSSIAFGRNGEFIAVSDPLKVVVVIKPDFQSKVWNSEIFPEVSYESVCDKFPRAFEHVPESDE